MSATSCSMRITIKNKKGEIVDSILFEKLRKHFGGNRKSAKIWWEVAKDPTFLAAATNSSIPIELDKNGEMTFKTLQRLTESFGSKKAQVLTKLNDDINAGEYSFEDAINKLTEFNRNSDFNDNYLATITASKTNHGKWDLSVVERTVTAESELNKILADRNLAERLTYRLRMLGVEVNILPNNAAPTANAILGIINVSEGATLDEDLALEASRFIINAFPKNPLVQRLQNLMSEDLQKSILNNPNLTVTSKSTAEAAASVLAKSFMREPDKKGIWSNLVQRIKDFAVKIISKLSKDRIRRDMLSSEEVADQIANGILSYSFLGDVEAQNYERQKNAILGSAPLSLNLSIFKDVVKILKVQSKSLSGKADKLMPKIEALTDIVSSKVTTLSPQLGSVQALEGIATSVKMMQEVMVQDILPLLTSIEFSDLTEFSRNIPDIGKKLYTIRTFTKNSAVLSQIIDSVLPDIQNPGKNVLSGDINNMQFNDVQGSLANLNFELKQITSTLANSLEEKENQFFTRFCQDVLGKTSISRATRILFGKPEKGKILKGIIRREKGKDINISDLLNKLESDISIYDRFLASASNCSDIIVQIADKRTKLANKEADENTAKVQVELRKLKKELKDLGYKPEDVIERDSDGNLTGNFISEWNVGQWENDLRDFELECRAEFLSQNPDLASLSDFQKSVKWDKFYRPKLKRWHKGDSNSPVKYPPHSTFDKVSQKYRPNDSYINNTYITKVKGTPLESWLTRFLSIKAELDGKLEPGSTTLVRMPQFRGTSLNRIKNKRNSNSTLRAIKETAVQNFNASLLEDVEDWDFGSDITFNKPEDDIFGTEESLQREKIRRVPLFGINKLKDMNDLSTDIFYSMFAYAGMVNTYKALNDVVDVFEVGKSVLSRRKVGSDVELESNRESSSRAYTRYLKFLRAQVYNVNVEKITVGKIVLNKVAGILSGLASKIFLGGNIPGGLVNAGTGAIELLKESFAGEHFDLKNWKTANALYFKHLPANMWTELSGDNTPNDKIALMIQKFNILGNEKERSREWHTDVMSRLHRISPLGDNLFLPYKAGEHYMQSIAYLGLADSITVYDRNNKPISLLNAYKKIDNGDGVYSLELVNDAEGYGYLKKTYSKIKKLRSNPNAATRLPDVVNKEESKYLKDNYNIDIENYSLATVESLIEKEMVEETKFYKESRKSKEEYDFLDNLITKYVYSTGGNTGNITSVTTLNQEEQDYLNKLEQEMLNNKELVNPKNILHNLNKRLDSLVWSTKDESDFMDKAREINNRMHGIYNKQDKVAIQQELFLNMLTVMKGYALGLMERRFRGSKYSMALGGESEGSVTTALKVITSTFTDRKGFQTTIMALFTPVLLGQKTLKAMQAMGFSENQYYNMRRNFGDFLFIGALALIKMVLAKGEDDDDDDWFKGMGYYLANRLFREQSAYNLPNYGFDEVQSLTSLVPVGVGVATDFMELANLLMGAAFVKDVHDSRYYYQQNKPGVYSKYDPKWEVKLAKMIPWYRSLYVYKNPYEASKSYEYGRRLKVK